ncbi:MAG: hypothetical protein UR28_C0038G0012 [Candidatus Peregrinibacteria bacterium GW2011_GWF2_33_10]|nr:MAG: hypothetical protein UR28_C0038G0012 [Candidatus Peregrinibacteria bacterium GW2011_GWF2_33_10]
MSFFRNNFLKGLVLSAIFVTFSSILIFSINYAQGFYLTRLAYLNLNGQIDELQTPKVRGATPEVNTPEEPQIIIDSDEKVQCNDSWQLTDYKADLVGYVFDQEFLQTNNEAIVYLYIKNSGQSSWYGINSGCNLTVQMGTEKSRDRSSVFFSDADNSNWLNDGQNNRLVLIQDEVKPDQIALFKFMIKTPIKAGIYREFFDLLMPSLGWFNRVFSLDISVGDIKDGDADKISIANITSSTANFGDDKNVEIDLGSQEMYLRYGEERFYKLRISSGNPYKHPTPKDHWEIANKQELRISNIGTPYRMPFWMGLSRKGYGFQGYGLHGLPYLVNAKGYKYWDEVNEPGSHLGKPVSHGCVRMEPVSDKLVWDWTEIGTEVWTH